MTFIRALISILVNAFFWGTIVIFGLTLSVAGADMMSTAPSSLSLPVVLKCGAGLLLTALMAMVDRRWRRQREAPGQLENDSPRVTL
jgi:hypothetical protein